MASSSQLEAWYEKVHSRRVDLVGDYAGNELFLVEGDSLLLHAFSDPNLDFDDGFQLLHATYNVENFLKKLVVRGCNFHVGFIDDHETLCIPPNATHHRQKYLLARTAIIRHLEANLPESNDQVTIKKFPSVLSKEFLGYLQETGMYFVMLHDGAHTVNKDSGEDEEKQARNAKKHLRFLVHWLVQHGYNVALMNDLQFVDTKVCDILARRAMINYKDTHSLLLIQFMLQTSRWSSCNFVSLVIDIASLLANSNLKLRIIRRHRSRSERRNCSPVRDLVRYSANYGLDHDNGAGRAASRKDDGVLER